ncbi:MAG: helix-turn-helix domain-containing protein, partial [Pseudomonadota bacterium]
LPPLRARPADISLLADFFARRMAREMAEDFPGFAPSAIAAMEAHAWPGNVRELRNFAQRITYRAISEQATDPVRFDPAALDPFESPWRPAGRQEAPVPTTRPDHSVTPAPPPPVLDIPFEDQVRLFETSLVDTALSAFEGHQGKAAKSLGLSYHQFRGLLKKYGYGKGASKPEPEPKAPIRSM